jgi:hypothetical protein
MFRCEITGKVSQPGEKLNKVIAITRPKTYTKWVRDEESHTPRWVEVPAGTGFEPVLELSLSQEGLNLWNSWTPEERALFLKGN